MVRNQQSIEINVQWDYPPRGTEENPCWCNGPWDDEGQHYLWCREARASWRFMPEHLRAKPAKVSPDYHPVERPKHYNVHPSGIECIQITEHMNFNLGNAVKYVWRADEKNGVEDLRKAIWYLEREVLRRGTSGGKGTSDLGVHAEVSQGKKGL